MCPQWQIQIDFSGYTKSIKNIKKYFPTIEASLQSAGQKIRSFCEQAYSLTDKRFGAYLGSSIYKVRIKSDKSGKRGGIRLIYAILPEYCLIVPMLVYSKKDKTNITNDELKSLRYSLAEYISQYS